jgi:hypothetical protein
VNITTSNSPFYWTGELVENPGFESGDLNLEEKNWETY